MSDPVPFELETAEGRILHGLLDLPAGRGPGPAVVVCHGFKGFMEWGFFPHLATLLAERGFVVVRFNFSGSGMRPGEDRVSDPEAFRTATFTRDVAEIHHVLQALPESIAPGRVDADRVGLLAHSRGGGAAILSTASTASAASAGRQNGSPRALVTWAAVASFDRLGEEEKEIWRQNGEVPVVNARTGQTLPIGAEVLRDLEEHGPELDIRAAAAKIHAPWLIVHGGDDETVPVAEAHELASAAPGAELLEIDGAGHTFGAVHPFAGPTPHLIQAMNATQTWFRRHLGHREHRGHRESSAS